MQTPLISNYACLVELLQQSQLQAAQASCFICTQGLHLRLPVLHSSSACWWLLPAFLSLSSSFRICSSYQHFPLFPDFHPYPRVSAVSVMQVWLHRPNTTVRRAGRAQRDQTSPFCSLHKCTMASRAMGWVEQYKRLKEQNGDFNADASKKKIHQKCMKPFSSESCSHPTEIFCCVKAGFQLKRFLPSSICLAGTWWSDRTAPLEEQRMCCTTVSRQWIPF